MKLEHTVAEVAALVGGRVEGEPTLRLSDLRSLDQAGPADLAPVLRRGFLAAAGSSAAGCLLVDAALTLPPTRARTRVVVPDADAALERLVLAWGPGPQPPPRGVHASAIVEPDASVAPDASVGAGAYVGARARVGAGSWLGPGVVLGEEAVLGRDCRLSAHAVVGWGCRLGDRVVLHAGAVIGADGFGFRRDAAGRHARIAQRGDVVLGDDVEVGPNSTIDRGRFDSTVIGAGSKIDAQVHIGHNVVLGRDCAIAGQCALAGHARLGDRVLVGGMSGISGESVLGDDTLVNSGTHVYAGTAPGERLAGSPARPARQWAREVASLARLPALLQQLREGAR